MALASAPAPRQLLTAVGQMRLLPVAQCVFRRAYRGADAPGEIFCSVWHAQQFALRLDDVPDQGLVANPGRCSAAASASGGMLMICT